MYVDPEAIIWTAGRQHTRGPGRRTANDSSISFSVATFRTEMANLTAGATGMLMLARTCEFIILVTTANGQNRSPQRGAKR